MAQLQWSLLLQVGLPPVTSFVFKAGHTEEVTEAFFYTSLCCSSYLPM